MGKKTMKKGGRRGKNKNVFGMGQVQKSTGTAYNDADRTTVDTNSADYIYDEVEQFNQQLQEKSLQSALSAIKPKKAQKENVMRLDLDLSDEDEEQDEDEESDETSEDEGLKPFCEDGDLVENREQKLPSIKAWGKDKDNYYGSKITDQQITKRARNLHRKAVNEAATFELEAHREYQQRTEDKCATVNDMELLTWGEDSTTVTTSKTNKKSDLGKKKKKLDAEEVEKRKQKIFEAQYPEFQPLMDDMEKKLKEKEEIILPILKLESDGIMGKCNTLFYVRTKYRLITNYVLNVIGYGLLVKGGEGTDMRNHPVMKKLATYRRLFQRLERMDKIMKPQLIELVRRIKNNEPLDLVHPANGKSVNTSYDSKSNGGKKSVTAFEEENQVDSDSDSDSDAKEEENVSKGPVTLDDETKRHIGKVISDNKGLVTRRKKADKNPRIKYKRKYDKKLKRRKGMVQEAKKETKLYSGEAAGINAFVVKSRKIN